MNRAGQLLTTRSVRRILGDLCDEAGIEPEGPVDYLQPHGARRGVGDSLYVSAVLLPLPSAPSVTKTHRPLRKLINISMPATSPRTSAMFSIPSSERDLHVETAKIEAIPLATQLRH